MLTDQPQKLFGMIDGFGPITNLLGAGDPNVHKIDDQWSMFFGGFQRDFTNNLFSATLAPGEPLHDGMQWRITGDPEHPSRARPLCEPSRDAWDRFGRHEPCFVSGRSPGQDGGRPVHRVYYAGRSSRSILGNDAPYSIGFLERTASGWHRHPEPVITGDHEFASALAPKVIYADGTWHMWFRATPNEPGRGERPISAIHHATSDDGISWSQPATFYDVSDGYSHAYTVRTALGYEMLLSPSPNLFGESFYPRQTLSISTAERAAGERALWSSPREVLDAESGEVWYRNGFFGSSLCEADGADERGDRYIFFTGVHTRINWPLSTVRRLSRFKRPLAPAPFHFTIGYARIPAAARPGLPS